MLDSGRNPLLNFNTSYISALVVVSKRRFSIGNSVILQNSFAFSNDPGPTAIKLTLAK